MYMTLHRKARLTVTVDAELVAAANDAVAQGEADSVSSWVNKAMTAQSERERRLAAMAAAIADYEAEFGTITEADLAERHREDRAHAIRIRHGRVYYPDGTVTDADGNILDER
jgi:Arc/MetJ-type ribon-helix-helix transcriptional regulator